MNKKQIDLERERKKDALARSFGWTRDELDEKLDKIKDYFTQAEKEARKKGTSIVKEREIKIKT